MTSSNIPLWGRAWKLTVKLTDGSVQILTQSSWDPEALRIVFDVLQSTLPSPFWYADIALYNLNDPTLQNVLFNAAWITLEAGYQSGPSKSSIIWDGPVLQVIFDRENVVDLVMRFNCLATDWLLESAFVNLSQGPMSSQLQLVSKFIAQTGGDVDGQVSPKAQAFLAAKQYPRGKTVFGKVSKYISEMAGDNNLNTWIKANQQYLSELYDPSVTMVPNLVYGPPFPPGTNVGTPDTGITRSILGVPKQSPFGCVFTVLLDPRLSVRLPPLLVKIDLAVIQQLKIQYNQALTPLDKNGLYIAAQIRHYGDTRGNDWHTEVTGYTRGYSQNLLNGVFIAAAAGVQ